MFNFPWGPLAEQVDDRGPFAEQALQVDKKKPYLIWYNHTLHETVTWGHCSPHKLSRAHARVSLHRGLTEPRCEMTVISNTKHKEMASSNDIEHVLLPI